MKLLALDDEKIALEVLTDAIREACPKDELISFRRAKDALFYLEENPVDIVFLDIEMPVMDGIEVARQCKRLSPSINLIFVTSYGRYRSDAFDLHASGYLTKPVTAEDILREIEDLRYPVSQQEDPRLRIQTFGSFEVFYQNIPVDLNRKEKEMFAYLVDREGASVTNNELYSVLYEDEADHEASFKKTKKNLLTKLENLNCGQVILKQRGRMAICTEQVCCDFYDWKKDPAAAPRKFQGEYMTQYSWAEYRIASFRTEQRERNSNDF